MERWEEGKKEQESEIRIQLLIRKHYDVDTSNDSAYEGAKERWT